MSISLSKMFSKLILSKWNITMLNYVETCLTLVNLIVVCCFLFVCFLIVCLFVFVFKAYTTFCIKSLPFFQNPQVILCCLFLFITIIGPTHLWPTFPHQEKFDPLGNFGQHCVCWGGVKGYRGKFKRCGLGSGSLKCSGFNVFFKTEIILFFFPIGVGCLHAFVANTRLLKKKWYFNF